MDLASLVAQLIRDREFEQVGTNEFAQFGPRNRRYLGAELMPERLVNQNAYEETRIRYMTVIANAGSRYSPAQLKEGGQLVGSMNVMLGHSDIARQFTGRDYDAVLDYLERNASMDAAAAIVGWSDRALNQALVEHNELSRWQCIDDALTIRVGDNGYREEVVYPDPAGHRVAAGGDWSDPLYDPWPDIINRVQFLKDKGYTVRRIITSNKVIGILSANPFIARRTARIVVLGGTAAETLSGVVSLEDLNAAARKDGLPPFEAYDLRYATQVGWYRFKREDVMTFIAETDGEEEIIYNRDPSQVRLLMGTIGYVGVGRAVGMSRPGRRIYIEPKEDKPPRIKGEAWQTSLPVNTDPEAVATIEGIA